MGSPWGGRAVALAAVAWLALVAVAPLLPVPAAGLLYAIGALVCHQIAERSFHLDAFQLPVCARCAGLYAGGAMGSVAAAVMPVLRSPAAPWRSAAAAAPAGDPRRRRVLVAVTLVAALPTLITFTLEWGGGVPVSNTARAIAGVPLGLVVAFVVVRTLDGPEAIVNEPPRLERASPS